MKQLEEGGGATCGRGLVRGRERAGQVSLISNCPYRMSESGCDEPLMHISPFGHIPNILPYSFSDPLSAAMVTCQSPTFFVALLPIHWEVNESMSKSEQM